MKMKPLDLVVERLGPLPLVNHLLERLGVEALLERFVPTTNGRCRLPYAKALGVLLRSILTEREPIYRQQEVVDTFAPAAFGLSAEQARHLQDDQIGRALDRLFDADRGSLLTALVVAAGEAFDLDFGELHNDSTTVRFAGQYAAARGRSVRGRKAPFITYGYSKDHRPDLKQLLFILSTTRDGSVPVQFRCEAGNHSDSRSHEETWQTLVRVAGRTDFLYVADSKLCSGEAMEFIDRRQGRFLTVLPRSRLEDREFREWIQTHEPDWEKVLDRRNPRRKHGPRDRWFVFRHLPSQEGWPVTWIFSQLLKLRQQQARRERIARTEQRLDALARHLRGPRPRHRPRHELQAQIDGILRQARVRRYVKVTVEQEIEHVYRQERPGRPGPDTRYVRKSKARWRITWQVDEEAIAYDHHSDGMYPLLSNDRTLTAADALRAHKRQPMIEKRFQQTKTVLEIAPVLLKNEGRIEALFVLYFIALMVQGLLERELRRAMEREAIKALPLYPEERPNRRPTAEQILRLFSHLQRNVLLVDGFEVRAFEPELTDLQQQVLGLIGTPASVYTGSR